MGISFPILHRYEHFYNENDYREIQRFVETEGKTLDDYEAMIKKYHDLMVTLPIRIEETKFTGLFKVSRKIFVNTVVQSVYRVKCLLTDTLIHRYQYTAIR